jgi:hypothetical protein
MHERPDQCPVCGKLPAATTTGRTGEILCRGCGTILWYFRISGDYVVVLRRDAIPDNDRMRLERLAAAARDSIDTVEIIMELEEYRLR